MVGIYRHKLVASHMQDWDLNLGAELSLVGGTVLWGIADAKSGS